jgi:DNA-binding transcriptional LysR family regulator
MALGVAVPVIRALETEAPDLRCELVEAEPEHSLPALALGDLDLVLADEWRHQPRARPEGVVREDIIIDPVSLVLPVSHRAVHQRPRDGAAIPLAELAAEPFTTGHPGTGWEEVTIRACRELGGFDPDIRHRTNDAFVGLALVAAGQAVMLLPDLVGLYGRPGITARPIAEGTLDRTIFMATRAADAARPSIRALREAVRARAAIANA